MNRFTSYVTQKMKLAGWLDPQEAKALRDEVVRLRDGIEFAGDFTAVDTVSGNRIKFRDTGAYLRATAVKPRQ